MVALARVVALIGAVIGVAAANHGYKSSRPWLPRTVLPGTVTAEELVSEAALPKAFDWRNVNGLNLATADWNQHIPQYCGGCWIHGTTSALNDRIKVMRGGQFPDVMLGRQALTNCVPAPDGKSPPPGCDGGDSWMIHKYLQEHKVPDESCLPYEARNMGCMPETVCRNCFPGGKGCFAIKNFTGYGVSSYGNLSGEVAMMKEIYARGPIACSFATDDEFMMNYSKNVVQHEGVYVTDQVYTEDNVDHVMEVAGWGETASGLKYWVIRNSWGTYWGSTGWLKLRRGVNQQLSEAECDWAVPTFDDLDRSLEGRVLGDYVRGISSVHADGPLQAELTAAPAASGATMIMAGAAQVRGMGGSATSASFAAVALAFASGAVLALLAARFAGGAHARKQPPLLG